jgi:hypothetical protein
MQVQGRAVDEARQRTKAATQRRRSGQDVATPRRGTKFSKC